MMPIQHDDDLESNSVNVAMKVNGGSNVRLNKFNSVAPIDVEE